MPPEGIPPGAFQVTGTVLERASAMAWVDVGTEVLVCELRGKMRQLEPCVVGDRVRVHPISPGKGVVEEVLPRRSELKRGGLTGDPIGRTTAANLDQLAVVISAASPAPRWALADRLLVEAEREGLKSLVVVNKIDLASPAPERAALDEAVGIYRAVGLDVHTVSAVTGAGLPELEERLRDRITVLSGHSGVGKSSLLNVLAPGHGFRTREVNPVTGKGRHTTTSVVLVPLPRGGHVGDTPGFREYALVGVSPPELGRHYAEFLEAIASCRFKDCLHRGEPGCAVLAQVGGRISKLRYQNYLQILNTLLDKGVGKSPRRSARRWSSEPS